MSRSTTFHACAVLVLLPAIGCSRGERPAAGTFHDTAAAVASRGDSSAQGRTPGRDVPRLVLNGPRGGCADVLLYASDSAMMNFVVIDGDSHLLNLEGASRTFDLAGARTGLSVTLMRYARSAQLTPFCNDVKENIPLIARWPAAQGTLTIGITMKGNEKKCSARIHDLLLRSPDGRNTIAVDSIAFDSVVVGWLAG